MNTFVSEQPVFLGESYVKPISFSRSTKKHRKLAGCVGKPMSFHDCFASEIWALPRFLHFGLGIDICTVAHSKARWVLLNPDSKKTDFCLHGSEVGCGKKNGRTIYSYNTHVKNGDDGRLLLQAWDEVVSIQGNDLNSWCRKSLMRLKGRCSNRGTCKGSECRTFGACEEHIEIIATRMGDWDSDIRFNRSVHNTDFSAFIGLPAPVVESTTILEHMLSVVLRFGNWSSDLFVTAGFLAPVFEGEKVRVFAHTSKWTVSAKEVFMPFSASAKDANGITLAWAEGVGRLVRAC